VRSINDSGEIAGYFSDSSHNWHGFLYDGSKFTTLDYPQAAKTFAEGISDSGQVVGYYVDASNATHGFLYNGSTYASINDPSATNGTYATGINGSGEIVGFYDNASGRHGFIDMGGTFTTFDDPAGPSGNTTVYSNDDSGQIVGNYLSNGYQGFVATPMTLNSSVTVPAGAILDLTSAYAGTVSYAASTGTLKIETSSSFTGTIAGQLATTDVIDLADVSYASLQTPTYSGNNSPGTLTVSDGTHTAHLAFSGNYSLSSFQTSNDGNGGTDVIDPPLSACSDAAAQSSGLPDTALLGNYMASAFVPSAPAGCSDQSLSQGAAGIHRPASARLIRLCDGIHRRGEACLALSRHTLLWPQGDACVAPTNGLSTDPAFCSADGSKTQAHGRRAYTKTLTRFRLSLAGRKPLARPE
jgi:probable HAF family extracellular repeat protein